MADITVVNVVDTPNAMTAGGTAAASGGDTFTNDGRTFVYVANGATSVTVTATAQVTSFDKNGVGTVTVANKTITVGANETGMFGPFPTAAFNTSAGKVALTYDNEINVTITPVRFPADV